MPKERQNKGNFSKNFLTHPLFYKKAPVLPLARGEQVLFFSSFFLSSALWAAHLRRLGLWDVLRSGLRNAVHLIVGHHNLLS